MLFEGGLALGYDSGRPQITSGPGWEYCRVGKKFSFIKNLYGFNAQLPAQGFQGNPQGNNVLHKYSLVPALKYKGRSINEKIFASLIVANLNNRPPSQLNQLVKKFKVNKNLIYILFYDGEEVYTQIGEIRDIFLDLKGHKIGGKILYVRAEPDGHLHLIYHDGKLIEYFKN